MLASDKFLRASLVFCAGMRDDWASLSRIWAVYSHVPFGKVQHRPAVAFPGRSLRLEPAMKTISIVTPCYNEELNVEECHAAVTRLFANEMKNYRKEHIFCDNASTDRTLAILREIAKKDAGVRVIGNARNFGPLRNTYNGVMAASGDAVLLFLPADLQDPPELLVEFVAQWEMGYEIVYGIRATREEPFIMRTVRNIYYRVLTHFSDLNVPPGVGDFQLVDRRVVDAMRQVRDGYPFMRMMTFECGGRAIGIPYNWRARKRGFSKNRLSSLVDQALNGLVSVTGAPLRLGLFIGLMLATLESGICRSKSRSRFDLFSSAHRAWHNDTDSCDVLLRGSATGLHGSDRRVHPGDIRSGARKAGCIRAGADQFRFDGSQS